MMKPRTRKIFWFGMLLAAAWKIRKMRGGGCSSKEYAARYQTVKKAQ